MYAKVPSNHNSASGFAARQHDQINIQSEEILEAWCQNIPPVPGIDDLGRVVQAPLPRALPSAHPVSISDRPIDDVISSSAAIWAGWYSATMPQQQLCFVFFVPNLKSH